MLNPKKILILAPHTDDGELGCGGSIAQFCAEGKEVYYAAFSLCEKSLPANLPSDTLAKECRKATAILGIPTEHLFLYNYEVREFPQARQAILEELVTLQKQLGPDLVFIPSSSDLHQDHQVIHQEGMRAFKHCSLAGYELPWNNFSFNCQYFNRIQEAPLQKKIQALQAYASQAHRHYMQEDFVRSLARVRGVQCNAPFAEAFELYRIIH